MEEFAGRAYAEVYRVQGRQDIHAFLIHAVERSGATVLYMSPASRAPIYLGLQLPTDERLGLLIYPFRMKQVCTVGRPADEVRGQLRYGREESWQREHLLGRDVAGVDITLMLGVDIDDDVLIGLDPMLYEILPMGISFYAKTHQIEEAHTTGWAVWERTNRSGSKRDTPRSPTLLETFVGFRPERLLDYARFERRASTLGLEPALRHAAAEEARAPAPSELIDTHVLEEQFALTSHQIIDIIAKRNRLSVAVRGGVAEYHLESQLRENANVQEVASLDVDAMHDFDVVMVSGRTVRIECKNASPNRFANGDYKVEVQKTRASQGDPASRFYRVDAFDIVAACMYSPTRAWTFRFARTQSLQRHNRFPDRLAPIQHIDESWSEALENLNL